LGEQFGGKETWSTHRRDPAMIATKVTVPVNLDESKPIAALFEEPDADGFGAALVDVEVSEEEELLPVPIALALKAS
jgi:hypothetical protein